MHCLSQKTLASLYEVNFAPYAVPISLQPHSAVLHSTSFLEDFKYQARTSRYELDKKTT